jgi:hypothetical protein
MHELMAIQQSARHGATAAHRAFSTLKPITPDYPTLPIADGFNWSHALADLDRGAWYLVVFRSLRKVAADTAMLTEFDERAHREALEGDGLLFYFQGQLNLRRECLSFCVWETRERALAGARLPLHQAAAAITADMYDHYRLERYELRKDATTGAIAFERVSNEQAASP